MSTDTQHTRESLSKLSERALAEAYNAVTGESKSRIKDYQRENAIAVILGEKAAGEPAKASDAATTAAVAGAAKSAVKAAKKGGKKAAAKKGAKKAATAPKEKKPSEPRESVVYKVCRKKNPYREGSMKAKSFDKFAEGGSRADIIAAIVKLGATPKTASSWIQFFRKYAEAPAA